MAGSASFLEPTKSHALTCEMMFNEPVTHVSEHPLPMSPGRTSRRATSATEDAQRKMERDDGKVTTLQCSGEN
jgi:hypothetical protein